jgi:tyrosine-protein kinase Etk/Wzc
MAELHKNRANNESSPIDFLIVLAKHSRMIVFGTGAVTLLTFLILLVIPNKYTATAQLLPPQQNMTLSAQLLNFMGAGTPSAPSGNSMAGMASSLLGLKSPAELYVAMMTGNTTFDRIIERFKLRKLYDEDTIEETRKELRKKAKVVALKNGLISIEVTDKDPQRAAGMANAFYEELDGLLRRISVQEAKGRMAFMEKEREQSNQNLAKAENALRTFSEEHGVIQIDTQAKGVLEYVARLRAMIDAKEVQIKVMRQQATSYNYDVMRLETEIKALKENLITAEKQYEQACAGDVCLTTAKLPALGMEFLRLYREVKFQDALYQLYTKMAELTRLDMMKEYSIVQVVDRALPPEKRSNTRLLPTLLVGILALFAMIFGSFTYEYWQNNKDREETSQSLDRLRDSMRQWAHPIRGLLPTRKKKAP